MCIENLTGMDLEAGLKLCGFGSVCLSRKCRIKSYGIFTKNGDCNCRGFDNMHNRVNIHRRLWQS